MVVLVGLRYGWLLLAVPFVLAGLWAVAERGLGGLGAPDAVPLSVKVSFWQNAAAILHDFPFTGVGLGQRAVHDVYEAYMLAIGPTFSHAHNAFVQAYLEQGLLGLFGLVSLTLVLLFSARRAVANARSPLAWSVALAGGGAAIVQLFEGLTEVVLLTSVGTVLLLVALGLLTAAGRLDAPSRRARPTTGLTPERRSTRLMHPLVAAPLAAALVAIGLVTFTLTPLASPLFLNLGAVERTRAILTDDLSREERERGLARADNFLRRALAADDGDAGDLAQPGRGLDRAGRRGPGARVPGRGPVADLVRGCLRALSAWAGQPRHRTLARSGVRLARGPRRVRTPDLGPGGEGPRPVGPGDLRAGGAG